MDDVMTGVDGGFLKDERVRSAGSMAATHHWDIPDFAAVTNTFRPRSCQRRRKQMNWWVDRRQGSGCGDENHVNPSSNLPDAAHDPDPIRVRAPKDHSRVYQGSLVQLEREPWMVSGERKSTWRDREEKARKVKLFPIGMEIVR